MPPTANLESLAGQQRVVVHAGTEQVESAFATEGVVGSEQEDALGAEVADEDSGEDSAEVVEAPGVVGEEAVESGPVSDADLSGGEDAFGDVTMSAGKCPSGEKEDEESEGRCSEDIAEGV
jgi:hypothetical protein